jgi:hypothetical protein
LPSAGKGKMGKDLTKERAFYKVFFFLAASIFINK